MIQLFHSVRSHSLMPQRLLCRKLYYSDNCRTSANKKASASWARGSRTKLCVARAARRRSGQVFDLDSHDWVIGRVWSRAHFPSVSIMYSQRWAICGWQLCVFGNMIISPYDTQYCVTQNAKHLSKPKIPPIPHHTEATRLSDSSDPTLSIWPCTMCQHWTI